MRKCVGMDLSMMRAEISLLQSIGVVTKLDLVERVSCYEQGVLVVNDSKKREFYEHIDLIDRSTLAATSKIISFPCVEYRPFGSEAASYFEFSYEQVRSINELHLVYSFCIPREVYNLEKYDKLIECCTFYDYLRRIKR